MSHTTADVLLHPVRLQIVAHATAREVTSAQLAAALPDVPHATLYRHIRTLIDAGVLDVVSEEQVRGTTRRTLRTNTDLAVVDETITGQLTAEQLLAGFRSFVGLLMAGVQQYLDSDDADPVGDGLGFRQARVWATDDEFSHMVEDLRSALAPYLALQPTENRRGRTLSTVVIPDP